MRPGPIPPDRATDSDVAASAARAGAEVIRQAYGIEQSRVGKSATDFTTETDVASERAILGVHARHRPNDAFEGEESGLSGESTADRRWLVDPMCGTANFAATTPLVSVNVALVQRDEVRVAAVADPIAGELFWTDGQQALVQTPDAVAQAAPSATSRLVDVNGDGPVDAPFVGAQLIADPTFRTGWGPRVVSTTLALTWVAAGRRAGYITDGRLAGDDVHSGLGLIAAADAASHADLVELVQPHLTAVEGS